MTLVRLALPSGFSFDGTVRSHGWYDLPPFSYDRERGVLRTHVESTALTPTLSQRERERDALTPTLSQRERERDALTPTLSRRGTLTPTLSKRERERERGESHEVAFRVQREKLEARSDGLDSSSLRAIARRVFSLDLDFSGAARSLAALPALAAALESRGARMLRAPTIFEDAVKMLFTTNCSWAATRGMVARLIELAGADGRAFPTPESVARLSTATLAQRVRCGYRTGALRDFAKRVASGKVDLSGWEGGARSSEDLRAAIVAERGFGPYAAEGLMRILGRHDFFALDSWTRQQYRRRYPGPTRATDRSVARRYARFGAHRGLALWLEMTEGWHE